MVPDRSAGSTVTNQVRQRRSAQLQPFVGMAMTDLTSSRVKRSTNPQSPVSQIIFDLTNPYVIINQSQFTQSHVKIHLEQYNFEAAMSSIVISGSNEFSLSRGWGCLNNNISN